MGLPGPERPRDVRAAAEGAVAVIERRLRGHAVTVDEGEQCAEKLADKIEKDLREHPEQAD